MEKGIIISPIFYMGCKKKLIKKGLIDLFPKNIDTFIDVFGGSGIVSMNVEAQRYILNDIDINLYNLYQYFGNNDADDIIMNINNLIKEYQLEENDEVRFSYDTRSKLYDEIKNIKHKISYKNIRTAYNNNREISYLYTILIYCFCHQMRFNSNNEFNMPCGNGTFTKDNIEWIKKSSIFFHNNNTLFFNQNYKDLKIHKLANNDLVYLDPPYLDTTATYNENGGWKLSDEKDLQNMCEELNNKNIKWAMSNVFDNKGKENTQLIEWCGVNQWNIHYFDGHSYHGMVKGKGNTTEVLITNYKEEIL